MLVTLIVHSYSFLPFSYNHSHRLLTELNVSLFLSHKTDFLQKYLMKTTHANIQAIKLNFIEQVCS